MSYTDHIQRRASLFLLYTRQKFLTCKYRKQADGVVILENTTTTVLINTPSSLSAFVCI